MSSLEITHLVQDLALLIVDRLELGTRHRLLKRTLQHPQVIPRLIKLTHLITHLNHPQALFLVLRAIHPTNALGEQETLVHAHLPVDGVKDITSWALLGEMTDQVIRDDGSHIHALD
jgi:hypothetical protein